MQLDTFKIRSLRTEKAWTQQQLAEICGLSLRTIQRVELHGNASLETGRSLAAAFEVEFTSLTLPQTPPPSVFDKNSNPLNSKKAKPIIISLSSFALGAAVGVLSVLFAQ